MGRLPEYKDKEIIFIHNENLGCNHKCVLWDDTKACRSANQDYTLCYRNSEDQGYYVFSVKSLLKKL